jgi:tetratricopeptide (TPR) repeat protein
MYGPGAQSDEILIFKPDGTGRFEFVNWSLCSADLFHWGVSAQNRITLHGFKRLELGENGQEVIEAESDFQFDSIPYQIQVEDTPSGKKMRVLRLRLFKDVSDHYGFVREDLTGLEEPHFDLPSPEEFVDNLRDTFRRHEDDAQWCFKQHRYEAAASHLEQALDIALIPYGNQVRQCFKQRDWESALSLLQEANVPVSEQVIELRHLGQTLNNIGYAYSSLGNVTAAEAAYKQALMIHAELLDSTHPDTAIALYNMGRLLQRQGDDTLAWEYLTQALDIWKRFIRDEESAGYVHYTASCLYALGEIMANAGELPGARRNFEHALQLRKTILPPGHADIAESLASLGMLCAVQGDLKTARTYLKKALPIFTNGLGKAHSVVQRLREALTSVERGKGIHKWQPLR